MPKWTGTWKGGRTYTTGDGRTVYVLRKMVAKHPYEITLDVRSEDEADAELALFLRDPARYQTRAAAAASSKSESGAPIYIDGRSVARFLEYLRDQGRTERYVGNVGFYLAAWAADLVGRDLRAVKLQDVLRVLGSYPRTVRDPETGKEIVHGAARKNRITSLKSFTAWLREVEASLAPGEDCTLALKVPAARPEKARRAAVGGRKGYAIQDVERLYRAIDGWRSNKYGWKGTERLTDVQPVRDVLLIHAKTGMHATEIERLAKGEGTVRAVDEQGEIAGTITFIHKSGRVHVQSIDRQTLAAVQRLQARKTAPVDSYIRKVVKRAAESIGMEPIRFGELRHSFVTWARECGQEVRPQTGGLSLEAIAAAIGHQSIRTTTRYYDNTQVPPMVRIPINLEHPEDPLPFAKPSKTARASGG